MYVKCERCLLVQKFEEFPLVECECGYTEWFILDDDLNAMLERHELYHKVYARMYGESTITSMQEDWGILDGTKES